VIKAESKLFQLPARAACNTRLNLPFRTSHTSIFCHASAFIDHGKCNVGVYNNNQIILQKQFHEIQMFMRHARRLYYNMSIRCNQKFMFCKDRGYRF